MADNVNHPKHYADTCSIECIDAMELVLGKRLMIGFCLGNAFKYLWRHKNKNGYEDLKKAEWYLRRADLFIHTNNDVEDRFLKLWKMLAEAKKEMGGME